MVWAAGHYLAGDRQGLEWRLANICLETLDASEVPARLATRDGARDRQWRGPTIRERCCMTTRCCLWCHAPFKPRTNGGKTQRFCRTLCRKSFYSACRAWAVQAVFE